MIVRIGTFTLGPKTREIAERAADAAAKALRANPACVSTTFYGDYDKGEYGLIAVWRTREAAEAGQKAGEPVMKEMLGPHLKAPPKVQYFEVYEPKA